MSSFKCLHRVQVSHADTTALRQQCERTEDPCHVPGELLQRFTLRGVPAARVDVLLPNEYRAGWGLVLEIGRKAGRFNGQMRDRLTIRHWGRAMKDQGQNIPKARLVIERREANLLPALEGNLDAVDSGPALDAAEEAGQGVTLVVLWNGGHWQGFWPCLRSDLTDYDLPAIVMWHHARYYRFLPFEEAHLLADSFEIIHPNIRAGTLAEANRAASRDLYRLARDLGWKKLTLQEKKKYGFSSDDPQWLRVERVERRRADLGYPSKTGTGQYTRAASNGVPMRQDEQDGYIVTSHGHVEIE